MQIGERKIGVNHPPYIIAEIGVNHDGEVARALSLTDAAADAGADAVKLQFFETDRLMSKAAKLAAYQKNAGETDPIEMLKRLELTIDEMALIVDRAHERGIHAIVTVFSTELVETAETLAWDAYKTASPDIVNRPLLEALMATGKPMIVSTGASTTSEVHRAYDWIMRCDRVALLQCVSCYPTRREDASIAGMLAFDNEIELDGGAIGYSDHTADIDIGALAVQIGAHVLEKHFTYDRNAQGPDHSASLEPAEMRQYIQAANEAPKAKYQNEKSWPEVLASPDMELLASDPAYGPIEKKILDCERDVKNVSRQSIVCTHKIMSGEMLRYESLTTKRPGTGISASRMGEVFGQIAARDIEADVPIVEEDLENWKR